jgi:hypothetical protein
VSGSFSNERDAINAPEIIKRALRSGRTVAVRAGEQRHLEDIEVLDVSDVVRVYRHPTM